MGGSSIFAQKRSLGITLIAVIHIIGAGISFFGLDSVPSFFVSLSLLLFGIGILRLKKWARYFSMIFSPLMLSKLYYNFLLQIYNSGLFELIRGQPISTEMLLKFNNKLFSQGILAQKWLEIFIPIFLYFLYSYYFTRSEVKAQFKQQSKVELRYATSEATINFSQFIKPTKDTWKWFAMLIFLCYLLEDSFNDISFLLYGWKVPSSLLGASFGVLERLFGFSAVFSGFVFVWPKLWAVIVVGGFWMIFLYLLACVAVTITRDNNF